MYIDFEKWHGAKNDFIVTWILRTEQDLLVPTLQRMAPRICGRDGSGVGADGILVIVHKSRKDYLPDELVIINSDGSLARNCGNGLRCAARSVRARAENLGITDLDGVSFDVRGRQIDCRFMGTAANPFVAVTMPVPSVGQKNSWHDEVILETKRLQSAAPALRGDLETVDLGNPHLVIQVSKADRDLALSAGSQLQSVREKDGINVHLVECSEITDSDHQKAKRDLNEDLSELVTAVPFERGAGLTMACGTGACAVAVTLLATGLTERDQWIGVDMPGGRLYAKQDSEDDPVILAGPAQFVFSGRIEI